MNSKFIEIVYETYQPPRIRYVFAVHNKNILLYHSENGKEYTDETLLRQINTKTVNDIIKYLKLNWDSLDTVIKFRVDICGHLIKCRT